MSRAEFAPNRGIVDRVTKEPGIVIVVVGAVGDRDTAKARALCASTAAHEYLLQLCRLEAGWNVTEANKEGFSDLGWGRGSQLKEPPKPR